MKYLLKPIVVVFIITQFLIAQLPEFEDEYHCIDDFSQNTIDWFKNNCVFWPYPSNIDTSCEVLDFNYLDTVDGLYYYYALYRDYPRQLISNKYKLSHYNNSPYNFGSVVIFVSSKNDSSLLNPLYGEYFGELSISWYEIPYIISTEYGKILCITMMFDGTGHMNDDKYYIYKTNQWKKLDSYSWMKNVNNYLPPDHGIWKGVRFNLSDMTIRSSVWKKGDGNCCPRGGEVFIEFEIEDFRFIIKNIAYIPQDSIDVH